MANCDPKTLPAQAACLRCIDRGQLESIDLFLLWTASGDGVTPAQAAAGGAPFRPFTWHLYLAAKAYLFAVITGSSTVPSVLASQAACFFCIPKSERKNVETYLYALSAGVSTNAATLSANSGPFRGIDRPREVELYFLSQIAGMLTPQQVMAGAKCFQCLTTDQLQTVSLYLLCQGLAANIIPPGSTYGPTLEFDIAILPNTYYRITWGANDVSATVCGQPYTSGGVGSTQVFYSGPCTLLQLFGNAAGTTVTALVVPVHNVKTAPTHFAMTPQAVGNVLVSWDTPPPGVASTAIYTSTDGVNYTQVATVAAPGTSTTVNSPGAAQTLYGKALWVYTGSGNGPFCAPATVFGNWAQRVINNGGAQVSQATVNAVTTFINSLISTTVWNKLIAVNFIAPDSFIAAQTPLIVGGGNDPWSTTSAPTAGNLSTAGWYSNNGAAERTLQTGLQPQNLFTGLADGGLTIYIADFGGAANIQAAGCKNAGPTQIFTLSPNNNSNNPPFQVFNCFGFDNSQCIVAHALLTGFFSGNRTSSAIGGSSLYWANSVQAFGALASSTAANTVSPDPALQIIFGGCNQAGALGQLNTTHHISFCAIHHGLTSSEAQTLFNAVQALRVAFGGGFT